MKCTNCKKGKLCVTETRTLEDEIYRRRVCSHCGKVIISVETFDNEDLNKSVFNEIKRGMYERRKGNDLDI